MAGKESDTIVAKPDQADLKRVELVSPSSEISSAEQVTEEMILNALKASVTGETKKSIGAKIGAHIKDRSALYTRVNKLLYAMEKTGKAEIKMKIGEMPVWGVKGAK